MELFHKPGVVMVFLPALVLAIVAEAIVYRQRNAGFPWRDGAVSLGIAAGHMLSGVVTATVITGGLALLVWNWRQATIDMGDWWNVLLLFVLLEFAYYWYHRMTHEVRLLWGSHSVHHSPEVLTLTAAFRLNWTPILSGSWLFFLPLVWLGFPPAWVFGMVSANLLYQFWLHTTLVPRLGWLEGVVNTPSAHRVHHASNGPYLDRNYGGVLMVWDRLFGTYTPEDDAVPLRFGLVHPAQSHNPFVIVFAEFRGMLRDVLGARGWRDRLGFLFRRPGWQPESATAAGSPPPAPPR